jgi:hypothetical protein
MIKEGYYINKEEKLVKKFKKTLKRYDKRLTIQYDKEFSNSIQKEGLVFFEELIPRIPYYNAASYQEIIELNAQILAITKAMIKQGKTVEDSLKIQAELLKEDWGKIPRFMGRIFVSKIGGFFLNKLAKKVTKEGWDTDYIKGGVNDDFDVSIVTKKCGVVEYLKSEGMTDYLKYCNFSDFLMFAQMNIGLKQPYTMESTGQCVFCMKYQGKSEIPTSLKTIYGIT